MLILILCFLYAVKTQDLLEDTFNPKSYTPPQVTFGDYRIIQYFQNLTFFYQVQQIDLSGYLHFDIHISDIYPVQNKPQVAFVYCFNEPCQMEIIDGKNYLISNQSDYNAHMLQKFYAHLIVQGNELQLDDKIYFSLLIPKVATYIYLLDVNAYEFKPCPQDCMLNFQGTCIQGKCKCEDGFIDEDCSHDAPQLKDKGILNATVNYGNREYIYYQPQQILKKDTKIEFKLTETRDDQSVNIFIQVEDQGEISLPTEEINKESFVLDVKKNEKYYEIKKELLKYDKFNKRMQRLIIGMQGNEDYRSVIEIRVKGQDEDDEEPDINLILIYFLVGVAVILLATWIILTIIRIKYQRQNQVYDQQQARNRRRNRKKQAEQLKIEIIDKYMPKQIYSEIPEQKKQIEDSCAVCLVDFETSDSCRVTTCFHVFHSDCLEQWLQKQQNCPICRTELNEKTLTQGILEVLSGQDRNTNQEEQQIQQIEN